jgi:serine/threonine protein kinase
MNESPSNLGPTRADIPAPNAVATPSGPATFADFSGSGPTRTASIGDYVLVGELGHGGMGIVYRAQDPALKREVAVKVMHSQFANNPRAKALFVREARAQAQITHDRVVAILHVGDHSGLPYLVMPLLKGMTLHTALVANPQPPLNEVLRIGREVADGLAAAHEQGLVHRDIKPANIFLEGKRLRVKILDFGLARAADQGATPDEGPVTREGTVVGTPEYMSPEQGRGLPVDGRTDLWSLGIVLYQMTTGTLPFSGNSTLAVLTSLAIDTPFPPISVNPAVPQPLSDFVMWLLTKDPAQRPPTAEAVAEQLLAIEAGLSSTARTIPVGSRASLVLPAAGADPFANLDAPETLSVLHADSVRDDIPARSARKPARTFPVWSIGAIIAGVLIAVGGITWAMWPTASVQELVPPLQAKKPQPTPKVESDPQAIADRKAALYVLELGGAVRVDDNKEDIKSASKLPRESFRLTGAVFTGLEQVSDGTLTHLRGCKNLAYLDLSGTWITDTGVKEEITRLTALTELNLDDTTVTDSAVKSIVKLPNLRALDLGGTGITDAGVKELTALKSLQILDIDTTAVTDDGVRELTALPKLDYLNLDETEVTDEGLKHVGTMKKLIILSLYGTKVTDAGLKELTLLKDLSNLDVGETQVTAQAARELKKLLPECKITRKRRER